MSRRHAAEKREVLPDAKFGSVVVTNPNRSPGTNPPPGGGGFSTPLQFTSGTATVTTNKNNTSGPSTTAANPVSPTR